jgi:hypothetical protein
LTRLPTGGRPSEGRGADKDAQHNTQPRMPVLPPRVVSVSPGPSQPADAPLSRGLRRIFDGCRVLFYMVVPLTLLAMIAAGILYVRLSHGPITFDFIVAPIERGINHELTSSSVKIDGAELRLGPTGELEFRLRDVSVLEIGGDAVLSSPLAAVNISMAALMRGRVVPARIELIDPVIALAYSEETGFVFERAAALPPQGQSGSAAKAGPPTAIPGTTDVARSLETAHKVNLTKMLSDSSRRARQRLDATSYLTEFGLSNATVIVDYEGQRSSWRIDEASVDFNHAKKRSVISGRATVASQHGPWAFSFLTDENEKSDKLEVKATVRDLVPSTLAAAAPPLALLRMFDLPVAGDATIELSTTGDVASSELALEIGKGRVRLPYMTQQMDVTAGLFKLNFDGNARRWQLQPSPVKWADGAIMFTGEMTDVAKASDPPQWRFSLDGKNGVFEAPEFNVPAVTVENWSARGTIVPRRGLVDVAEFHIAGGGGEATVKATTQAGPQGQSMGAEFAVSPMPLNTLKALWPRALAVGARDWVGKNVSAVNFKGGTLRFTNSSVGSIEGETNASALEHVTASFEASDAVFQPLPGMQTIEAARTLIQIDSNALEITVPDAAVVLSGDRRLPLKNGRLYAANMMAPRPDGEITVSTVGELGPFLEAIEQLPVRAVREASPLPKAGEGKVDAQLTIKLPLIPNVTGDDFAVSGRAKISDGRFGKVAGRFDVQGFTLNLDLSDTALDATGDLLVNGVPAKIVGQRLLGTGDLQPPLKIVAKLDEADRTQLGLNINDIVRGVVPVEVSLQRGDRPEPAIKLHADLTNAEIALDQLQWHKPPGHEASLDADIVSGQNHDTELQNFKVVSDDIAAEGRITVGADNKIKEFEFPSLMLNVVSRLDVQGARGKDDIWSIKVKGSNFDGRSFFRSLFNVGDGSDRKNKAPGAAQGARVAVDIDNVIGASDVSLRNVKMQLETRGGNLTSLDAKGTLDGGASLIAKVDQSSGARRLLVDSPDAGQVMKLVDFYPNMQGGRMRLEVGLDGTGPAEKTGTLWVEDFKVLGDPIVSEVVSSADQGRPAIGGARSVTREVFEFDKLRAPFSVGYGQFVLEESYLRGPLVGANLRGKVDFKTKSINLGGTYVPLQGLNGALGGIPLLGQIISGAQGEGIFGMTFAVQGPTSDPQVIVNPLSLVAPGIFREMFQMTAANPKVQVREDQAPKKPVEDRVRSSSSSPVSQGDKPKSKKPPRAEADAVDGWSSITSPPQ